MIERSSDYCCEEDCRARRMVYMLHLPFSSAGSLPQVFSSCSRAGLEETAVVLNRGSTRLGPEGLNKVVVGILTSCTIANRSFGSLNEVQVPQGEGF